jgi:hypothetical protein
MLKCDCCIAARKNVSAKGRDRWDRELAVFSEPL